MSEFIFHGIIQREEDRYTAICLELDIATEGDTLEDARNNLKEAVEGYIESVAEDNEEEEFIPRHVPDEVIETTIMTIRKPGMQEGTQPLS